MSIVKNCSPERGFGDSVQFLNHNCPYIRYLNPPKKKVPPKNLFYFVLGHLEIKKIKYPRWEEIAYYLNEIWINEKPIFWGTIGSDQDKDIGLYYISRGETYDWAEDDNFIGYYADDILNFPWSDKIFEAVITSYSIHYTKLYERVVSQPYGC